MIPAQARDDHPLAGQPENVLPKDPGRALPPAGKVVSKMEAGGGREQLLVARAHDFLAVDARNQRLASENVIPLRRAPQLLGWDVLHVGKGFAISIGGNRREGLIITLHLAINPRAQPVVTANSRVHTGDSKTCAGAVYLQRRPVIPRFLEKRAAQKGAAVLGKAIS